MISKRSVKKEFSSYVEMFFYQFIGRKTKMRYGEKSELETKNRLLTLITGLSSLNDAQIYNQILIYKTPRD